MTWQDCSECGHRDAANRKGDRFRCLACGHAESAHANAAKNVRRKGLAQGPNAPDKPRKVRKSRFGRAKADAAEAPRVTDQPKAA